MIKLQDIKLIHRNLLHFYILTTKKSEREIKEIISFKTELIRKKYLAITLLKEIKDLYSENYKTVKKKKKLKITQPNGQRYCIHGLED